MAALLVVLAVMSLMLSMALPVWHHAAQREREAELIFRGEQYARAIILYQRPLLSHIFSTTATSGDVGSPVARAS